MIARLILQNSLFVIALAAVLFASAGTLHWPQAWSFLATLAVLGPACGWWLARTDPALLAERMRLTARVGQPAADRKFMLVFLATALVWFVVIGIDRRAGASHVPLPLEALGVAMYLGTPLWLGSWWGTAMAPLFAVLFAIRAGIEERALLAGLPGYADYAAQLRYRLLPGLW